MANFVVSCPIRRNEPIQCNCGKRKFTDFTIALTRAQKEGEGQENKLKLKGHCLHLGLLKGMPTRKISQGQFRLHSHTQLVRLQQVN